MRELPQTFPHHRLHAYTRAIAILGDVHRLSKRVPRGHGRQVDQLTRAMTGVAANIAEGANRRTPAMRRQRYGDARGECGEVAAWLEILATMELLPVSEVAPLMGRLDELNRMLAGPVR